MRSILRAALLSLSLLVLVPASASAGTIIADSGFRPAVNGFSFENYDDEEGYKNLDAAEMRKIFGQAACQFGKGSDCVLNPGVRSWMDVWNESASGGHCYGFSALSLYIFKNQLPRFGYSSISAFGGGPNTFDLDITTSVRLQRSIARAFVFQGLSATEKKSISATPNQILDRLVNSLQAGGSESWNFAIFQWGFEAGHAITPYAVEDMGGGIYNVHVYDNNWPNDSNRRLIIDTNENKWSYYAATNPGQPQALYVGNANSKTLMMMPNLPPLGVQPCEVCLGRRGAKSKYNQISISGTADQHANLLITDMKGRKTGFFQGEEVNQIPGAKVIPQTSGGYSPAADGTVEEIADSPEPLYMIPKKTKVKIKVDGRKMTVSDRESLGAVGPIIDAEANNLRMGPGKVAFATLDPKRRIFSMTGSKGSPTPGARFGAQDKKSVYQLSAAPIGDKGKTTYFFIKRDKKKVLRISRKSGGKQSWKVNVSRATEKDGLVKYRRKYSLRRGQDAFLAYGPTKKSDRPRILIFKKGKNGKWVRTLYLNKVKES